MGKMQDRGLQQKTRTKQSQFVQKIMTRQDELIIIIHLGKNNIITSTTNFTKHIWC